MNIQALMRLHRLMAPEGGEGGGGAGAAGAGGGGEGGDKGAGQGGAAGAGGEGQGAAGAGDKGGDKSFLASMGKGDGAAGGEGGEGKGAAGEGGEGKPPLTDEQKALQAAEKDTRRPQHVPAKFWDATKGEVKFEAWAKSTGELETRMRTVGLPPKEASEYKFEMPAPLKAAGVDLDPDQSKAFREQAHGLGLTQKQYEGVMGLYFQHVQGLADQVSQFSATRCEKELLEHYKDPAALKASVRRAYVAATAYLPDTEVDKFMATAGNIPAVIRILDAVGKEMGEDPGVQPDAILSEESLQELMRGGPGKEDSPYWNASDPRHKTVVAKVARHHEAAAKARQRKAA